MMAFWKGESGMNNQGKVTILIENERGAGCTEEMSNEHGLSMLIEKGDTRILMDTGASGAFFKNAQHLGVSLEGLSAIVFSHNHYDHTGGILTLLENCPDTPIYLRAEAKRRFYRKKDNHFNYHGEPQDTFLSQNSRFHFIDQISADVEIAPGFFILNNHLHREDFYCHDRQRFYYQKDGVPVPDDFCHEQFLLMRDPNGDTIFTSCSHNGIINIIDTVRTLFPQDTIRYVIGGFHLKAHRPDQNGVMQETINCSLDFAHQTARHLDQHVTGHIYTCHCTGEVGCSVLGDILKDKITYVRTGDVLFL